MPKKKADIVYEQSVSILKKSTVVDKSYYLNKLPKELRALSFYISDLEKHRQTSQIVRNALIATEKKGLSFEQFANQFDQEVFKKIAKFRLEVVFRNNLMNTYNQNTRLQAIKNKDVTPYLLYDATLDGKTRPGHAKLDGIIRPADDPIWDTITPPQGHNCRCTIIPITKEDAAFERSAIGKKGLTTSKREYSRIKKQGGGPDQGFDDKKKATDVVQSTRKALKKAINKLPKGSTYRKKFEQSIGEVPDKVDIWYEKNKDIFKK